MNRKHKGMKLLACIVVIVTLAGCASRPVLNSSTLKIETNEKQNWAISVTGDLSTPDISDIKYPRYPVKFVLLADNKSVSKHQEQKTKTLLNEVVVNLNKALTNTGLFTSNAENSVYISLAFSTHTISSSATADSLSENLDVNVLMQDSNNRTAFKKHLVLKRVNKKEIPSANSNQVEAIIPVILAKSIIHHLHQTEML